MASTIWSGSKAFTAPSAAETVVPVPMPHRGILRGYSLVQLTGAAVGFTADLYSSSRATEPNASLPAAAFHVLSLADAEDTNVNVAYMNRDGSPSVAQRFLYLHITPAGSGSKNFVLSVTVETPMLR